MTAGFFSTGIIGTLAHPATGGGGLTVPATSVQVSFTDPFDTPDFVDITRWCKKGSVKRGRQHELQRAIAGTCALTVTNQDGRFSTFNKTSPYVNMMTAADSYFQDQTIGVAPGSWGNTTNCALSLVAGLGYDGYAGMSLTASSAATMSASTATGTSGYAVTAGKTYGFQAQFENATTGRNCQVGVGWYNSGGSIIGSVTYGSALNDVSVTVNSVSLTGTNIVTVASGGFPGVTGGMQVSGTDINAGTTVVSVMGNSLTLSQPASGTTTANLTFDGYVRTTLTAKAPALAAFAALFVQVTSPANGEVHYVTRCQISNADVDPNTGAVHGVSTAWAPGGRGLVPARPVKVTALWSGTTFPVFYGYVDSWLPNYTGPILSDQVINASDGLTLLALSYLTTSAYAQQVIADGAAGLWMMNDAVGSQSAADSSSVNGADPLVPVSDFRSPLAPTFGQPGLLFSSTTTAAAFPGFSAVQGSSIYQSSGGMTIEAVVETTSLTSLPVGTNPPGVATVGALSLGFTGSVTGTFVSYLPTGVETTGSISVNDGKPHHVAFKIDASGNWVGLVDGVVDASGTGPAPGSHLLAIIVEGFNSNTGNSPGLASITYAGVAVTQFALTNAQIATHAAMALHGFAQQQSGQRIAAVLGTLNVPAALQTLATGISAVQSPTAALTTTPALSYIQTVENTEQGFFYIDEAGQYTYRDRHYILQNPAAIVSNGTFADDTNPAHFKYLPGIVPANDALDLWNTWPVSAVANASLGVTGTIQDAPNGDSIKWYGKRTKQGYSSMLQTTDTEALSLSQWGIAHYAQPLARVRQMKLDSTCTTPSGLPQMLGRKLLDRITVIRQPIDGTASPFSQDSLIEDIQHDFTPDLWTTTWGLSVAETQQYLTLNDPAKGTLAATGAPTGNRLGF